jgi:hypothetical protein
MKTRTAKQRALRASWVLLFPWCGLALAQQAAPEAKDKVEEPKQEATKVETVVVTAERRSRPLQTSPISATVLSGDDLANKGINNVDQLMFVTPSATVNNFGQGIDFNIRGIGKGEHNSQTTTGCRHLPRRRRHVPGYFTGEPYYDIATVEILRGPAGNLRRARTRPAARSSSTSNDPIIGGGYSGYVQGQLGNYRDIGLQGALNIPLGDTLAARVAFNSEDRESFWNITGPYTGSDARLRLRSVRAGLHWQPTSALSVLFKTDYSHLDFGAYPADPVNATNDLFDVTANAELKAVDWLVRSVLHVDYTFANGIQLRSISGYQERQHVLSHGPRRHQHGQQHVPRFGGRAHLLAGIQPHLTEFRRAQVDPGRLLPEGHADISAEGVRDRGAAGKCSHRVRAGRHQSEGDFGGVRQGRVRPHRPSRGRIRGPLHASHHPPTTSTSCSTACRSSRSRTPSTPTSPASCRSTTGWTARTSCMPLPPPASVRAA